MAYEDLQDSSKPWPEDNDYFKVTVVDLDPAKTYPLQFRWQYEDKTYGEWSATQEFITTSYIAPEVTNIQTVWNGTTLTITWNRPEVLSKGVMVNRAKDFILSLTYNSKTLVRTLPVDTTKTQQTFVLKQETAREFWRDASNSKFFPTSYTGNLKVVTLDQYTSAGVNFFTTSFSDPFAGQPVDPNSWEVSAALDGYFVSWAGFTDPTAQELYDVTEISDSLNVANANGPWTVRGYSSNSPFAVVYFGSTAPRNVRIRHRSKAGAYTLYATPKQIASINPSGYDANGPSNNNAINAGNPEKDGDGLFDFNYKVPFSWTAESDTTTLGYRIRWRVVGPAPTNTPVGGGEYTNTVVPGRLTTTTYLYGVLAGQRYEVGKNTYDEYGNTTSSWQTTYVTIPAFDGTILGSKFLQAGTMKLGYGIGGKGGAADSNVNVNKGLFLGASNYWYTTGNTVTDSGAYLKVGSTTSNMVFDGTDLTVTGYINALGGNFTGTVSVGSPTVAGQLRVVQSFKPAPNQNQAAAGVEIGKFNSAVQVVDKTGATISASHGIYAFGTEGSYTLINGADGSIRSNKIIGSEITGSIFLSSDYGKTEDKVGGVAIVDGGSGDVILFSMGNGTSTRSLGTIVAVPGSGSGASNLGALHLTSGSSRIILLESGGIDFNSQAFIVTSNGNIQSGGLHSFQSSAIFFGKAYNSLVDIAASENVFRNIKATTVTGYPTGGTNGEIVLVTEP